MITMLILATWWALMILNNADEIRTNDIDGIKAFFVFVVLPAPFIMISGILEYVPR